MKTIKLIFAGLIFIFSGVLHAQISINVNITPPDWAPAEASGVRFYYMPDIQVYFDASRSEYIYQSNGGWVRTTILPKSYATFNLYTGYKVLLTDNDGDKPYEHFDEHCKKFPKGYNHGHHQKTWKEGHDNGHHDHDGDEHHDNGERNHGHGHGHGHGNDKHDGDDH